MMILKFKLVRVDTKYCDYLRSFDNKVAYNKNEKELRPFVGILFTIGDCEYFVPLFSPKLKHLKMKNTIDFFKIKNGKLVAINFNNMIPVTKYNYKIIYLNKKVLTLKEKKYQELSKDQLNWLNENYIQVKNKSSKLFQLPSLCKTCLHFSGNKITNLSLICISVVFLLLLIVKTLT